jgi:hypothetical protein
MDAYDVTDCAALQRAEDRALVVLSRYFDADTCRALRHWSLHSRSEAGWVDPFGREVSGLTWCTQLTLEVGSGEQWRTNAYAHELIHVVECWDPEVWSKMGDGHAHWTWQWGAIEEMQWRP